MDLDGIIDDAKSTSRRGGRKCETCKNRRLVNLLNRYFERLDAGEALPAISWLHHRISLTEEVPSFSSVRNHVMFCCKRTPTGAKK